MVKMLPLAQAAAPLIPLLWCWDAEYSRLLLGGVMRRELAVQPKAAELIGELQVTNPVTDESG